MRNGLVSLSRKYRFPITFLAMLLGFNLLIQAAPLAANHDPAEHFLGDVTLLQKPVAAQPGEASFVFAPVRDALQDVRVDISFPDPKTLEPINVSVPASQMKAKQDGSYLMLIPVPALPANGQAYRLVATVSGLDQGDFVATVFAYDLRAGRLAGLSQLQGSAAQALAKSSSLELMTTEEPAAKSIDVIRANAKIKNRTVSWTLQNVESYTVYAYVKFYYNKKWRYVPSDKVAKLKSKAKMTFKYTAQVGSRSEMWVYMWHYNPFTYKLVLKWAPIAYKWI